MRIAIGSLMQASNTFVPYRTTMDSFTRFYLGRDAELLDGFGAGRVEVPGFLSVLAEAGVTPVPLLAAEAGAGGPVMRETFHVLVTEMVHRLAARLPVHGVLLALHGAMVVEDEPDAEAEILERVRNVLPPGTPIGVSLDLHAHVTRRMLQPGVFLVGHREYPHADRFETGQRTARLLLDTLAGRCRPVMALAKRPLLVSPVKARTTEPPLSVIAAEARRIEADGAVLHACLFPVQPWIDVPELGFAALVCADAANRIAGAADPPVGDDQGLDAGLRAAQEAADRLADMVWAVRDAFDPDLVPLAEAIRVGLAEPGTTVVGDSGDAPAGGAAGDNASVLRALLAAGADQADRLTYLTLCDPEAARQAAAAGVDSTVTLRVGHRLTRDGEPVEITGVVRTITDGVSTMRDAGADGAALRTGLTVVLVIGAIRLVVHSLPGLECDARIFESVGLVLRQAGLVFVKVPAQVPVAFALHAARVLVADTPGATCGNMRRLHLRNVTRPLHPLDDFSA